MNIVNWNKKMKKKTLKVGTILIEKANKYDGKRIIFLITKSKHPHYRNSCQLIEINYRGYYCFSYKEIFETNDFIICEPD